MPTARTAKSGTVALFLALGAGLAACGVAPGAASRLTSSQPGAQLRALNLQSERGWHTAFEAVYRYTIPVSAHRSRTERFTIAQDGSKSLFKLGGAEAVDLGGAEAYYCRSGKCVADSFLPSVQPPSSFYAFRNLVDGSTFWSSTQGYPISVADLATRGVTLAFSTGTFAAHPSSCVTITYRSGPDGYPLRSGTHRSQLWCLAHDGIVDFWSSGRHELVLTSLTTHPQAATFEPPPHSTVVYPK